MANELVPFEKQPLDIPAFSGINSSHTRNLNNPSTGKNFWTRNGRLYTREGTTVVYDGAGGMPGPIWGLHSAKSAANSGAGRLIAEAGTGLWQSTDDGATWTRLQTDGTDVSVTASTYRTSSTQWNGYLIIVSGTEKYAYDIENGTITTLTNSAGDGTLPVPNMEFITNWNGYLFGWSPNSVRTLGRCPVGLTIAPQGTAGTTTWGYKVTAIVGGVETATTTEASTTIGNAILSVSDYNRISWTTVTGATEYKVYRSTCGGTPTTTGLVATVTAPVVQYDDVGGAGSGTIPNEDYAYLSSSTIRYNGYTDEGTSSYLSKDYWSYTHAQDVGGNSGSPVLSCLPMQGHQYIITKNTVWRMYGTSEEDFYIAPGGGGSGTYSPLTCAVSNDLIVWYNLERGQARVYAYSGTTATVISLPVEELLQDYIPTGVSRTNVHMLGAQSRFWMFFPNTTADTTVAFVFDSVEQGWYIQTFSFAITSACVYGTYMGQEQIYFGLYSGKVVKLDSTKSTDLVAQPITTEFVLGPFELESRKVKAKTLWVNAEPRNDFALEIYPTVDGAEEGVLSTVEFTTGGQNTKKAKLNSVKGQNISLRITTTDKIDELQGVTLTIIPKNIK